MEKISIFEVLTTLENAKIPFSLARSRPDTIRVDVTLYGLRLEVECFDDNHIEVSTFKGNEDIDGGFQYLLQMLSENK
jgi:hypothetical protein